MGSGGGEVKEVTILGRTLRWTEDGLELEADAKHRRILMREFGLEEGSNSVVAPMTGSERCGSDRVDLGQVAGDDDGGGELGPGEASWYRAMIARANYLAQDRMDLQYTTKELSRKMSSPTDSDWIDLKRLGRYLLGKPRVVTEWKYQARNRELLVYTDTDYA